MGGHGMGVAQLGELGVGWVNVGVGGGSVRTDAEAALSGGATLAWALSGDGRLVLTSKEINRRECGG